MLLGEGECHNAVVNSFAQELSFGDGGRGERGACLSSFFFCSNVGVGAQFVLVVYRLR